MPPGSGTVVKARSRMAGETHEYHSLRFTCPVYANEGASGAASSKITSPASTVSHSTHAIGGRRRSS